VISTARRPSRTASSTVKDLFGGHAPGEECGDAPKRGLLGLDVGEMPNRKRTGSRW
jgi:hypothetical protein